MLLVQTKMDYVQVENDITRFYRSLHQQKKTLFLLITTLHYHSWELWWRCQLGVWGTRLIELSTNGIVRFLLFLVY